MKLLARTWKPVCFLLLLTAPVAAIAFASRGAAPSPAARADR
jgi:hypothetical protein